VVGHRNSRILAISAWNDESAKELAEKLGASVLLDKMSLGSTLIPTFMQLGRECSAAV